MKYESDWSKTGCIVPTHFIYRVPKLTLTFDPWPKNNRILPLIIYNLHAKFVKKTVVCIMPSRFYKQSAKVDFDLWPCNPKPKGFLLSSSTMCMGSLKVIGQKLYSVSCPQGFKHRVPKLTLTFDLKSIGFPPHLLQVHVKFDVDQAKAVVCIVTTK